MTDNLDLVEAACAELADQGERITFTVVAELTGISRTTLYRNPQLRVIVEEHRNHVHDRRTLIVGRQARWPWRRHDRRGCPLPSWVPGSTERRLGQGGAPAA